MAALLLPATVPVLAAVLMAVPASGQSTAPMPAAARPAVSGDTDGDGVVTLNDVRWALEAAAHIRRLSPDSVARADVMPRPGIEGRLAGDGRIDVDDAARILAFAAGAIPYRLLVPEPVVTTLAGSGKPRMGGGGYADGPADRALFRTPWNVDVDRSGVVYVADTYNNCVRKIVGGTVTTLAGTCGRAYGGFVDGPPGAARFLRPKDVAVDKAGNVFVVGDDNAVRQVRPDGTVATVAGDGVPGYRDGSGTEARFASPDALALLPNDDLLVADTGNDCIRRITLGGDVTTFAGRAGSPGFADGVAGAARFDEPDGIAVDAAGTVYVADGHNNAIRRITPDGYVTTLAGGGTPGPEDGVGSAAHFSVPMTVAVDAAGNLYTSDWIQETIRKITPGGEVTTLAGGIGQSALIDGPGSRARFFSPMGLACTPDGTLYIADSDNQRIRVLRQR